MSFDWPLLLINHIKYVVQLQVTKSNDLATTGTALLPKSNDGTLTNEPAVIADAAGRNEKLVEVNESTPLTQPSADSSNGC